MCIRLPIQETAGPTVNAIMTVPIVREPEAIRPIAMAMKSQAIRKA